MESVTVPLLFVTFVFEAAFVEEVARRENYVRACISEMFAKKCVSMLDLEQFSEFTFAPVRHPHSPKIPATFAAMVCSHTCAWAMLRNSLMTVPPN